MKGHRRQRIALALAVGVPALLYLLTLYPGVGGRVNPGDSAKLQYIGEILGVPHEPGYPQYVALTWLWTRLPLPGELAWRVNLFSAFCALVAGGVFFMLARDLTGSSLAAMLGTWSVLLARHVWVLSTETEVYALNLLWVAVVLLCIWRWRRRRDGRWFLAFLLAYSLSLGNHLSMVTLFPGLLLLLLVTDARKLISPRWVAAGAAALVLGLGQYGFLLWRSWTGAPYLEAIGRNAPSTALIGVLTGSRFTGTFFGRSGLDELLFERSADLVGETYIEFLLPGLVLMVVGAAWLYRRDAVALAFFATVAAAQALFAVAYEVPDWIVNGLPLWMTLGLFVAAGIAACLDQGGPGRAAAALYCATLGLIVWVNFPLLHLDESPYDRTVLIEAAGEGGWIITQWEPNYRDGQIDNYYNLGLGLRHESGIRFVSVPEVFDRQLYLRPEPLYFNDLGVARRLDELGVDYIAESPAGDLAGWVEGLAPLTPVAVLVTDIGGRAIREELALALRPLGLGEELLASDDPYYAALSVKGPVEGGIERVHPTDAVIRFAADDPTFASLMPRLRPPLRLPWDMELYAGRVREGIQNRLTIGDLVDNSDRFGMRAFAFDPQPFRGNGGGEPRYEALRVDTRFTTALRPFYYLTGTRRPVHRVTLAPHAVGPPLLVRDLGGWISPGGADPVHLAVVSCRDRAVKVALRFRLEGLDESLARVATAVATGDWMFVAVDGTVGADRLVAIASQLPLDEVTLPLADAGDTVLFGRVGDAASARARAVAEPSEVELECTPLDGQRGTGP